MHPGAVNAGKLVDHVDGNHDGNHDESLSIHDYEEEEGEIGEGKG